MRVPVNHVWRLRRRPEGRLRDADFAFLTEALPAPVDGQVLVRTVYLSVDPTNRIWASEREQYMPPVGIGDVMRGGTMGVVERSMHADFAEGDVVQGLWGWQSHAAVHGGMLRKTPDFLHWGMDAHMSVLGVTGMTAYFGLLDIAHPKAGETLVVSAAAGAVGSIVGQIGKIKGCRVVGIAGGEEKCRWLTAELGFDAAIDYRNENVEQALRVACPKGVDVYFENVGGAIGAAVFEQLNLHARVSLCGLISEYNKDKGDMATLRRYEQVLMKRLRIEGFIILDYFPEFERGLRQMSEWLADGRIQYRVQVVDGLAHALEALNMLFDGANVGKLLVRVSPDPSTL